jgi:SAM-dependent methyltransferase
MRMSTPQYAHGHGEAVLAVHSWRTAENSAAYVLPHLRPGMDVLDVGCGPGSITADLARRVAPGRVVGVDLAEAVVEQARTSHPEATFVVGDAYALDVADDSFEVVHAHQVLQHLDDPVAALREMARVARPGGLIAVRDVDFGAAVVHPPVPDWLEIYEPTVRHMGGEPHAGRFLLAWAHEAGLTDVTCSVTAWCFATADERAWWGGAYAERVVSSAYALRAVETGISSAVRNAAVARAWRDWAAHPDGWLSLTHGELLARV